MNISAYAHVEKAACSKVVGMKGNWEEEMGNHYSFMDEVIFCPEAMVQRA